MDQRFLRELVRLRIIANGLDDETEFLEAWLKIIVSHYKGEESSQYFIERSLMRPRFLLNLINHCKSFAINLNHEIISESDIEKGLSAYASDLLRDIGYELRDIAPESENVLYTFIGCEPELNESDVLGLIAEGSEPGEVTIKIFQLLLWYGFLGLKINSDDPKFIYDFSYNKTLMDGVKKKSNNCVICINQAFWPALMIKV
ncbi:P-loop ATPase, Sll1717 family [Vreelandella stevensii]|uniref:P-loop ATPase, Sll1717 family n=1 Tax=Vreelandella stevensii TaxID=502821 RepID=UPI00353053D3